MWQNILTNILSKDLHKEEDLITYCDNFCQIFNIEIKNSKELKHSIDSYNTKLFPEEDFLFDSFNEGIVSNIIGVFKHLPNLELNVLQINNKKVEDYLNISNLYFFKDINFDSSSLLSKDNHYRTLSFMFLFFLPRQKVKTMLNEFKKQTPLLCNPRVTKDYFEMLLYLMQTYEKTEYSILKNSTKNLNHMLIENFLKENKDIFFYDPSVDWQHILPKEKMFTLFKLDISLYNFDNVMDKSIQNIFIGIEKELMQCERFYAASELDKKLSVKIHAKDKEVLKI